MTGGSSEATVRYMATSDLQVTIVSTCPVHDS